MEAVCLSPSIMRLVRTPAEKILLARICQRASLTAGVCSDTNNDLAQATAMHLKTVSNLISRLVEARLVVTTVDKGQANKRNLMPRQDLLTDYPSITDSPQAPYLSITDSPQAPYPSITDIPPAKTERQVKGERRLCPMTSVDITHQRPNCRLASCLTLHKLQRSQPEAFRQLVDQFLSPGERPSPYVLAERIRKLAKGKPIPFSESKPQTVPLRLCPISGIDVSHQQERHRFATAWTIEALFQSNRSGFNQVADRLLPAGYRQDDPAGQCFALSSRIRRLARAYQ